MKNRTGQRMGIVLIGLISFNLAYLTAQDGLIIQEAETGVCTMDGDIDSSAAGYTGIGYANIIDGTGIGMSWSFSVPAAGTYRFYCRYALGGSDETSRDAEIIINNHLPADTLKFPYLSTLWSDWSTTDTVEVDLQEGLNTIRLSSITHKGLPNIDYFHILGSGISAEECVPAFTFSLAMNIPEAGEVSYEPVQYLYEAGTQITVEAAENSGYFFHSWSGEESSTENPFTFELRENTNMEALFYPDGTTMENKAIGYATVQHDNGTPYLLTGGALGDTVVVDNTVDLRTYLEDDVPRVVILAAHLTGTSGVEIKIGSNKTLLGVDDAHIEGMRVSIQDARNVIIKDIIFSMVIQFDEIEINPNSQNIWIDHCEFYTDMDHDVDYYDGLLDIKNQSRFLTISWSKFHDHHKCILMSSGDTQFADSVIRATFHHNYFYNAGSRLPSLRFGKAHIFNNYYHNISTGVNSRMNACIRVEHNYFEDAGQGVGMLYSPTPGAVELIDNIFVNTGYSEEPVCILDVPYDYLGWLDDAVDVPQLVSDSAGVRWSTSTSVENNQDRFISGLSCFPNPAEEYINLRFLAKESQLATFSINDLLGNNVAGYGERTIDPGWNEIRISTPGLVPGVYVIRLETDKTILSEKFVVK